MKQSLGRLIALLFISINVWGATYQWRTLKAPESLYVNQSGVVQYECIFSTSAADYTIDFKPKSNENYTVSILTQRDRIVEGKRVHTFDLLVTPLKKGDIGLSLEALVRHTTFASIENASIGRDNVKKYDFDDEKVTLPKVHINVKGNSVTLSGDMKLEVQLDKRSVIAHEPVHLSLYIKGKGNLDHYSPYQLKINGVNVFAEVPQKNITPSAEGFEGEIREEFALVSEKSYVIPPITIDIFDTTTQKIKRLQSEAVAVEVAQGYERSNLLDPPQLSDWSTFNRYSLYGVLIFIGVVLGQAARWAWKHRPRRRKKQWWDQIKTQKELILMLALNGDKRYEKILIDLETNTINLDEAKNKLNKLTSRNEVKV